MEFPEAFKKRCAGNFLLVIYSSRFFVLTDFIFFGFFFRHLNFCFFLRDTGKNEVQGQLRGKVSAVWALMLILLSESQPVLYPSARDFPFLPQVHTHTGMRETKPVLSVSFITTDAKSFSVKDWLNTFSIKNCTTDTPKLHELCSGWT